MHSCRRVLVAFGLASAVVYGLSVPLAEGQTPGNPIPLDNDTKLVRLPQVAGSAEMSKPSAYSRSHFYGSSYGFSPRDGWGTVAVTDLPYKYDNATGTQTNPPPRRQRAGAKRVVGEVLGGTVSHALGATWNSVKGSGKSQDVTITWYTGEDLANPSCWPESDWAPTDASFACALTLEGWTTKPSCFKFLELCNGPDKCIFVRVVDTCAGCKKGSKHVDLTKAAFAELADLDLGILTVQMRIASDPRMWHEELWGPKV
ncbi:hypothetical protein RhiJN_00861 [Ceratobasidium sp. AG-Ba]|nr:hypothetical protein RhiJN_00861 [Ceratobasidium sp. AG-Ba]QRW01891.1 hypothetical protein RhiLY_00888 [Ceratobasidium sp. AG-Ba]